MVLIRAIAMITTRLVPKVMPTHPLLHKFFFQEPAGHFALGHVLTPAALEGEFEQDLGGDDVGRWQCDIANNDALTWSEKVYEIFGLSHGSPIAREEAVARYREHSRGVMERLRAYAINHKFGFILDAEISPRDGETTWIRVLAAPIVEEGKVVGLHGLKRVLS